MMKWRKLKGHPIIIFFYFRQLNGGFFYDATGLIPTFDGVLFC